MSRRERLARCEQCSQMLPVQGASDVRYWAEHALPRFANWSEVDLRTILIATIKHYELDGQGIIR